MKYKANGDEEKGSERLKSAMRILALGLALLLALALPLSGCAPSQTAGTVETPEAEAGGERAALFDPSAYRWDRQTSTLYQTAEGEETALLVDEGGHLIHRADRSHRQIVNEAGWVSHDPAEIAANVLAVARAVVEETGDRKSVV